MQLPLPHVPVPIPDWLHRRASRAGWSDWLAVQGDPRPHCRGGQEAEVRRGRNVERWCWGPGCGHGIIGGIDVIVRIEEEVKP